MVKSLTQVTIVAVLSISSLAFAGEECRLLKIKEVNFRDKGLLGDVRSTINVEELVKSIPCKEGRQFGKDGSIRASIQNDENGTKISKNLPVYTVEYSREAIDADILEKINTRLKRKGITPSPGVKHERLAITTDTGLYVTFEIDGPENIVRTFINYQTHEDGRSVMKTGTLDEVTLTLIPKE
jgi:hypothetical protein